MLSRFNGMYAGEKITAFWGEKSPNPDVSLAPITSTKIINSGITKVKQKNYLRQKVVQQRTSMRTGSSTTRGPDSSKDGGDSDSDAEPTGGEDKWLTVGQLSSSLNIKEKTIYSMVEKGLIPHLKFERLVRVEKNAVKLLIEKGSNPATSGKFIENSGGDLPETDSGGKPIMEVEMGLYQRGRKWWICRMVGGYQYRIPTEEEWQRIVQVLSDPSLEEMSVVTFVARFTGARRSEILALKRKNINLEDRAITFFETKNKEPRTIPICETLMAELVPYLEKRNFGAENVVFPGLTPDRVTDTFRRIVRKLGITGGLTFHSLRKAFATGLNAKGVDLYTISRLTGHKQLEMLKRYIHPSLDVFRDAIARQDKGKQ